MRPSRAAPGRTSGPPTGWPEGVVGGASHASTRGASTRSQEPTIVRRTRSGWKRVRIARPLTDGLILGHPEAAPTPPGMTRSRMAAMLAARRRASQQANFRNTGSNPQGDANALGVVSVRGILCRAASDDQGQPASWSGRRPADAALRGIDAQRSTRSQKLLADHQRPAQPWWRVSICGHFRRVAGALPRGVACVQPVYRPRGAEHTVLHQVIREHLEPFLREAAEAGEGGSLPKAKPTTVRRRVCDVEGMSASSSGP
jgi:hypothetical protein